MRRRRVGGVGHHLRHRQPGREMIGLHVGDGVAADMDRDGGEPVPDVGDVVLQRHRRGLQLEGRAGLVHAGDGAVEALVVGGVVEQVGVVVGQADHGDDFAGAHVHHDGAGADRLELGLCGGQLVTHHRLHAHVEREAQRLAVAGQAMVEIALHAGDAMIVDIDRAHDLRRGAAERIAAFLARLEIDAGNAEVVDRKLLLRRDLARDVDELLLAGQPSHDVVDIQRWQDRLQLLCRVLRVHQLERIGEHRRHRQRDREDLAVAVGDGGAPDVRQVEIVRHQALGVGGACRQPGHLRGDLARRRRHRMQHGGEGELEADGAEQHPEAARHAEQAHAHALHQRALREIALGDANDRLALVRAGTFMAARRVLAHVTVSSGKGIGLPARLVAVLHRNRRRQRRMREAQR